MILAQVETVIVEKVLEGIAKQQGGGNTYVFVGTIVLLFIGSFAVLKYMLTHAKEIHDQAQNTIRDVAADHKVACETITETFNNEIKAARDHHDKVTDKFRDMVVARGRNEP